jgi:hypothetical protein
MPRKLKFHIISGLIFPYSQKIGGNRSQNHLLSAKFRRKQPEFSGAFRLRLAVSDQPFQVIIPSGARHFLPAFFKMD